MIVIIPNEIDGLQNIIENLNSFNRTRLLNSGSLQDMHVYLPKFTIQSAVDLKMPLEQVLIYFNENIFINMTE
jgi:uncharacterized membrane protein